MYVSMHVPMSMTFQQARDYCLGQPEAYEDYPFGPDVCVYKVANKMFATLSDNKPVVGHQNISENHQALKLHHTDLQMNLKCDPDQAAALRDLFAGVVPGYHMNKRHWNTVYLQADVPDGEVQRMIEHSYRLVVNNLAAENKRRLLALLS